MSPRVEQATAVLAVAVVGLLGACGGDPSSDPAGSGGTSPTASSAPPVLPSDSPRSGQDESPSRAGLTLRGLGFRHGPVDTFPVPSGVVSVQVDQPTVVTLVITAPPAAEVYAFYLRELPGAGFRVDRSEPSTTTLSLLGHGWHGSVTGQGSASAVVLRPT